MKPHLCFIPLVACLLVYPSFACRAFDLAPGCDAPDASERGSKFFVDPARGAKENDGSERRPWRTLAEVLDPANHLVATRSYGRTSSGLGPPAPINPGAPIKPGDTIVLMSGDHGAVEIKQYVNGSFISVVAGEGQTPLIRSLHLVASSHWFFRGLKFQGVRPETDHYGAIVKVLSHNWFGPTDNIVFVGNSFSAQDSTERWSPEDWVNKPYAKALDFLGGSCMTVVGNHFFNLRDAVGMGSDHALLENNLIENIGNDGIDINGSDLILRRNTIRSGRHSPTEPLHADGIQGWSYPLDKTNRNVVIDANRVINLNPAQDNYMQGISIFDGHWDGLTVTNNLVVTNAWHGISLWGVDNAVVLNNTVIPARPDRFPSWLMIHNAKDKTQSQNVIVRNNIATQFVIDGQGVTFDHNIAQIKIVENANGRHVSITQGDVGDRNVVNPGIFHTLVDLDLKAGQLDARPSARSPAAGAGSGAMAPETDIDGRPRKPPVDIGAFAR